MRGSSSAPRADLPGDSLWRTVHQALENERCLDLRYRSTSTSLTAADAIPNYKVMKQLALRNRLGPAYRPFIALATMLVPALAATQWLRALFAAFLGARSAETLHVIATTPANTRLIDAALNTEPALQLRSRDYDILALHRLGRELGLRDVVVCIVSHGRLLGHILRNGRGRRTDLILHSRDAFVLIMLARYSQLRPTHCFATDDHYQRWAFVLSHCCRDLRLVQHGFLDPAIGFPHPFGRAHAVYVRDALFSPMFAAYFQVLASRLFSPASTFAPNAYAERALFLASSFPSIDEEIELLRQIRAHGNIPVIVKFHPAHAYDSRKQRLAELATWVCADDRPACRAFVSHNSFMEFDYKIAGIRTFSMLRSGGATLAARAIIEFMEKACPASSTLPVSHSHFSPERTI
jgi:hypothetical protein